MSHLGVVLAERLLQQQDHTFLSARYGGEVMMLISLLIGSFLLWGILRTTCWGEQSLVVQETAVGMVVRRKYSTQAAIMEGLPLVHCRKVQQVGLSSSARTFMPSAAAVVSRALADDAARAAAVSIPEPSAAVQKERAASSLLPGNLEDRLFELDKSVLVWKELQRYSLQSEIKNFRDASLIAASIATGSADGSVYALAHGLRTGYFAANALLGTLGSELNTLFSGWHAEDGLDLGLASVSLMLLETAMCYRQDFRAISDGQYKLPWDMYTLGHRQYAPDYIVTQTRRAVEEAIATFGRRARGGLESDIGTWVNSSLYPDYYLNNFHYQTDGWMSARSAHAYETSTETLFLGRQDAMQRLSLLPLRAVAGANKNAPRILEIACGTGRFATFIRDNHPTAEMTIVDLSPFYLESARENDAYWRKMRYPIEEARPPPATFVQAAAEALPFKDASFDAVVCIYLFHEMPEAARAAAAAEMARVVSPGGVVILTDSVQRGDRPILESKLGSFAKINEPHFKNYISTYIPDLFVAGGLACDRKWVESSTKCLSFRKPFSERDNEEASASGGSLHDPNIAEEEELRKVLEDSALTEAADKIFSSGVRSVDSLVDIIIGRHGHFENLRQLLPRKDFAPQREHIITLLDFDIELGRALEDTVLRHAAKDSFHKLGIFTSAQILSILRGEHEHYEDLEELFPGRSNIGIREKLQQHFQRKLNQPNDGLGSGNGGGSSTRNTQAAAPQKGSSAPENSSVAQVWRRFVEPNLPRRLPQKHEFECKKLEGNGKDGLTGLIFAYYNSQEIKITNCVVTMAEYDMPPEDTTFNRLHLRILKKIVDELRATGRLAPEAKLLWCLGFAIGADKKVKRNSCANQMTNGGRALTEEQLQDLKEILEECGYKLMS